MEDFKFLINREIPVPDITTYSLPIIVSVPIWWYTQMNKQNSEKIPFFCDAINPWLCPIAAAIRIVRQACFLQANPGLQLGIQTNHNNPLQFKYITASNTTTF